MKDIKFSKSKLQYFFLIIILYTYLYNPPLSGFSLLPIEILLIISLLYITLYRKWLTILLTFKIEVVFYFLIIGFCFLREFPLSLSVFFKANVFLFFQGLILPYFIVHFFLKIKRVNNLLKDIIYVGVIASIFTLIMLFIPSIGDVITNKILKTNDFTDLVSFRSFGFSEGLTFAYGTIQGLIFTISLYYAKKDSKFYFFLPLLFLSVIFNARIGLVPVIFGLTYFIFVKINLRLILGIIISTIIFYYVVFNTYLLSNYVETIEWAFDFFIQSSDFLSGNADSSENTFDTLFGRMAIFPLDTQGWLFGTGENIFLYEEGNSDVGYLIQLNYGGILYLILLFGLVFYMMFRLKFLYKIDRWIIFLFLITIIITNIKGLMISIIPSFRLIALIYCYLIIEYKKVKHLGEKDFNLYNI